MTGDPPISARDHSEGQAENWITLTHTDPQYDYLNKPKFLELVPAPGRLAVDVGCGEGRLARELIALGRDVVGIDASPALARAAAVLGVGLPVVVADIATLPMATGVADVVVCFMVLMDVEDLQSAVAEIARVMAPAARGVSESCTRSRRAASSYPATSTAPSTWASTRTRCATCSTSTTPTRDYPIGIRNASSVARSPETATSSAVTRP